MSEDFLKDVKILLVSGKGDAARLREIIDFIKQKHPVYMSDYKYVQSLISGESQENKTETKPPEGVKVDNPVELLRIRLAEGKITIDEFRELKKAITEI
ncbi:MAG: hypothetical protein KGI08_03790 [Thaumarchaeota archaeon]|nr:hypothetical protein [Nitrososphaerota archaeon]